MTREEYVLQARSKAAKFCALKERAPQEVREKLKKWELSGAESEVVIHFLMEENYLDEQRFAKAFCHDKFEFNQWGRIKIRAMISKYHLPNHVVNNALAQINQDRYFEVLSHVCSLKWDQLNKETNEYIKKQKAVKYLLQKGFESDQCWAAVNKMS